MATHDLLQPEAQPDSGQPFLLFQYGFRVFFLSAGMYACLAMFGWLVWLGLHQVQIEVIEPTVSIPIYQWHAHEMLFGYAGAVIAGFLLTAVPNWTATRPLSGTPLVILATVWALGRLAMGLSTYLPATLVAVLDLAFLPMLAGFVAAPLFQSRNRRNWIFIPLLLGLFAANLLVHVEVLGGANGLAATGHKLAVNLLVVLLSLVGGRVVPAFTRNWLTARGEQRLPVSISALDLTTVLGTLGFAIISLFPVPDTVIGGWAAVLAALHLVRQGLWRPLTTLAAPIVLVLQIGYAWIGLGFALIAWSLLGDGLTEASAYHALTVGAIGSLTLAVMSRAALGHTGRDLVASVPVVFAYGLVSLSAAIRVIGPNLWPEHYGGMMLTAGLTWFIAFGLFCMIYWPILTSPRIDGRPG